MTRITVSLPVHLRNLARVDREVVVEVGGTATIQNVLDALEARYPMLRGTIRDHRTHHRRAFMRYFAAGQDVSHEPPETPLPAVVLEGAEPFCVIGAISGG